jgi:hypothetical protein
MNQKDQDIPLNIALGQSITELLPLLIPGMNQLLPFSPQELKTTLWQSVRREADALFLFRLPQEIPLYT